MIRSTLTTGPALRSLTLSLTSTSISQKAFSTNTLKLNDLRDAGGARKSRKILCRGIGSGLGKTGGSGHKGQKSRSGGSIPIGFEGGQTPIYKRVPKKGFKKPNSTPLSPLSITRIENYIAMGLLDPSAGTGEYGQITMKDLIDCGCVSRAKHGVKILSTDVVLGHVSNVDNEFPMSNVSVGAMKYPINIEVSQLSKSAISSIEAGGGTVTATHFNRLALRALLKPEKFAGPLPKRARPPPKKMDYYTRFENRGYLSPEVQLGRMMSKMGVVAEEGSA